MTLRSLIIDVVALLSACACSMEAGKPVEVSFAPSVRCSVTKAGSVNESMLSDINVFITGEGGIAEDHLFWVVGKSTVPSVSLVSGKQYSVFAFANAGYDMGVMGKSELETLRWHLQRPDGFDHGMPMSCRIDEFIPVRDGPLSLEMCRLTSRISVHLDRSRLDADVDFFIKEARIGNCPRSALAFSRSSAEKDDGMFPAGYYAMTSDDFELYTLENCQGRLDKSLCSYVEMEIDYKSTVYYSKGEKGLLYRFYIRENDGYDVERNCHYLITVRPNADGLLCEDSWRVDKSSLAEYDSPVLRIVPSGTTVDGVFYEHYYRMGRGDSLHFRLSYSPKEMKVLLDEEMVIEEKETGRACYSMDRDRKGFSVRSLGRICQSSMNICAESPYDYLDEMIVIDVEDRGSE